MKKTETIRFSVRPEMKEGLKMLFKGKRYSDLFEEIMMSYLNNRINNYNKDLNEHIEGLKIYQKGSQGSTSVEEAIIGNIDSLTKEVERLKKIQDICFPNHSIEIDKDDNSLFVGYEDELKQA